MTTSELLKLPNCPVRLECVDAWLYYDDGGCEWVVMRQGYYKRKPTEIIRTPDEAEAVAAFGQAAGIDTEAVPY